MPKMPKNAEIYECKSCDFVCNKESNYTKHLSTRKHHNRTNRTDLEQKNAKNADIRFGCECGKTYSARNSLWYHKQRCTYHPMQSFEDESGTDEQTNIHAIPASSPDIDKDQLILDLIQQNRDLSTRIMEYMTTSGSGGQYHTNSHNNTNNSHNKTFNMQIFLNETCKDAMNITDFVNSLKLTLQDLERVGELGYAEGISRVFVKGLNDLDITKRPIHCSDVKREVLHIKDQDKWEKDTANQDKLKNAIRHLSNKNIMLLDDWQKKNPGCTEYDNRKNSLYLKIQSESMGPIDEYTEKRDFNKITRAVAKSTIIKREQLENQTYE